MRQTYILSAVRTPIGAFNGGFKDLPAHQLGSLAIRAALERSGVPASAIDEVLMGNVLQAGQKMGPARQAALGGGIPVTAPAWTVNQLCGSGLKSVCLASTMIAAGDGECMIAGGMENMTLAPHLLTWGRTGARLGHAEARDSILHDGLTDAFSGQHMGITAEAIAEKFEVTRDAQDEFAAESQRRAGQAMKDGRFDAEIAPVSIPQRKGDPIVVKTDEHPKPDSTKEKLAKLKPAFKDGGTVTAGNSSGINDGAAALVIASEEFVQKHGVKPIARIAAHATTGLEPQIMGMGPVEASRKALARAGWKLEQIERAELNEAFAAQAVAVVRQLGVDPAITNVNGGAIALGHPIGASGARILVTLLHELARAKKTRGLAALCVGGGMGTALVVERL